MKLTCTCILASLLASRALVPAATPQVLPVAVFDFESKDEAVRDLGPKVAALINVNLSAEPNIITVERAELEKVLGEQELGLSGNVQPDSAAKLGHLTGAKVLVTGRVFKADKELIIVSRVIGTETSRVYAEMVKGTATTPLSDLASELSKKVAAAVEQKADTLVARAEGREELVARIKKGLPAGPRPTVSIKISEQHFGRPVNDPAAETELGLLLQQCGFTLVGPSSTRPADVELTGEAFSALGLQKGNLVSCKGRVELKALKQNGDILAVDRQTSVAVDIAEQTAAKAALQGAVAELAERMLPRLTR